MYERMIEKEVNGKENDKEYKTYRKCMKEAKKYKENKRKYQEGKKKWR